MKSIQKKIVYASILVIASVILVILFPESSVLFVILVLTFILLPIVSSIVNRSNNMRELYERLGVSSDEEFHRALSEYDVLIEDRLYIKNETVINIRSKQMYYLYEIQSIEKKNHKHYNRGRRYYYTTYELNIVTDLIVDCLYYDTDLSGRDCAYLLLSKKLTESRRNSARDAYDGLVSNDSAYSMDAYDDMIMDEEDIKDRENRSDWLG